MTLPEETFERASLSRLKAHFRDNGKEHKLYLGRKFLRAGLVFDRILNGVLVTALWSGLAINAYHTGQDQIPLLLTMDYTNVKSSQLTLTHRIPLQEEIKDLSEDAQKKEDRQRLAFWNDAFETARRFKTPAVKTTFVNWMVNQTIAYDHQKVTRRDALLKEKRDAYQLQYKEPGFKNYKDALAASLAYERFIFSWQTTPLSTLKTGDGVCIDVAVLKAKTLMEAGIAPQDIGVLTLDLPQKAVAHAVTLFRKGDRFYILNNAQENVKTYAQANYNAEPELLDNLLQPDAPGGYKLRNLVLGDGRVFDLRGKKDLNALPKDALRPFDEISSSKEAREEEITSYMYMSAVVEPEGDKAKAEHGELQARLSLLKSRSQEKRAAETKPFIPTNMRM